MGALLTLAHPNHCGCSKPDSWMKLPGSTSVSIVVTIVITIIIITKMVTKPRIPNIHIANTHYKAKLHPGAGFPQEELMGTNGHQAYLMNHPRYVPVR